MDFDTLEWHEGYVDHAFVELQLGKSFHSALMLVITRVVGENYCDYSIGIDDNSNHISPLLAVGEEESLSLNEIFACANLAVHGLEKTHLQYATGKNASYDIGYIHRMARDQAEKLCEIVLALDRKISATVSARSDAQAAARNLCDIITALRDEMNPPIADDPDIQRAVETFDAAMNC